MPLATLEAFADHGDVARAIELDPAEDERAIAEARAAGLDLGVLTGTLEREGVESFLDSYERLSACIDSRLRAVAA